MFAEARTPEHLTSTELDAYLERGWFRMGQTIFTTNFVHFQNQMYSAVWLRVLLHQFTSDNTQQKLFKRNAVFRTTIGPSELTSEKEDLYKRYKQSLPFQPSESLHQLLLGKNSENYLYNTHEVTVHDGDRLIAVGFFDLGETSAMGISSVYDPDYKKYSLGKYLIYQKMEYCKMRKLQYFYPGYFVPGYSFFDYKLTMGRPALQFLSLSSQQWSPIQNFSADHIPFQFMFHKLKAVQHLLEPVNLTTTLVKYEYFDANLIPDLRDAGLFDFPVFLFCPEQSVDGINPILVFDVRDQHYHLQKCIPVWKPDKVNEDPEFYSMYLLKSIQDLYTTKHADEMAEFIRVLFHKPEDL